VPASRRHPATAVLRFGLGAAFALIAACSGTREASSISVDDFARAFANAFCDNIGPCCTRAGFSHDLPDCHAKVEARVRPGIDRDRNHPNLIYDGAAARSCIDIYTAALQSCRSAGKTIERCDAIFVGRLEPGQACANDAECSPGSSCRPTGNGAEVVCTLQKPSAHGKLGDTCIKTCTVPDGGWIDAIDPSPPACYTSDGLYCSGIQKCATNPAIDGPCTSICANDAFCDNGVCAAKRTSGSCNPFNGACADVAYCDSATQQCMLRKMTGQTCTIFRRMPGRRRLRHLRSGRGGYTGDLSRRILMPTTRSTLQLAQHPDRWLQLSDVTL
jgi:hypothetical protein